MVVNGPKSWKAASRRLDGVAVGAGDEMSKCEARTSERVTVI
jgi:hypothetical protein